MDDFVPQEEPVLEREEMLHRTPLSATLRTVPLFADLPAEALAGLADIATLRDVAAGEVLYRAGERPRHLFVLLAGQIDLGIGDEKNFATVEVLHAGDEFVLSTVLLDQTYITSARAVVRSKLLCVSAPALRASLEAQPKLAMAMLAALSRRSRAFMRQIGDLKRRTVTQRLGCFLLALAREQGNAGHVVLPFDKRLLASRLGATPEHLSRAFVALRACGVGTRGRTVTIADPAALAAFAQADEAVESADPAAAPEKPA